MRTKILVAALVVAIVSGTALVLFEKEAQNLRTQTIRVNGEMMGQIQHRLEDKLARITEGWVDLGHERRQRSMELQVSASRARIWANRCAWVVTISVFVAALVSLTGRGLSLRRWVAGVTLVCWTLGLTLPVLTLAVVANITSPFNLGQLLLREETKSLLGLLASLGERRNWFLLGLVGVFGVGVPLTKTICQLMSDNARAVHAFGDWLARWALVDVVVVGVMVAFLGSQGDPEARADLRLGFWFFALSGLLSWVPTTRKNKAVYVPKTLAYRGSA